jgi:predicted transcriptional regulator
MLVKDIMNTNVRTARPDSSINEVAIVMCFNKISGLPVIVNDNEIVGIISEKDILKAIYPNVSEFMESGRVDFEALENEYRDLINMKVEELMTPKVLTVTPEDPVLRAVSVMCVNKIRRIPVAVDGELHGIISMGDVHKAIFQKHFTGSVEPGLLAKDMHMRPAVLQR